MTHCDNEATWSSSSLERLVSSIVSQSSRVYGSGNNRRGTKMRKQLMMSTVALLAGLAVASAQQMPGGDGQRGEGAQKQQKQEPRGATSGSQKEQSREGASSRSKGEAQGKQAEQGRAGESKSSESKSGASKSGESKSSTTGQGGREQGKQAEPQNGKQGQRGKQAEQGKSG